MNKGKDVTIFCTGHLVWKSLEAAKQLEEKGISVEVINIHTIKPFDTEAVLSSVSVTKCAVTAEEHQLNGGLGDSVAHVLSCKMPLPLEMVAVQDSFGESGKPDDLMHKYGLGTVDVVNAVYRVLARKN